MHMRVCGAWRGNVSGFCPTLCGLPGQDWSQMEDGYLADTNIAENDFLERQLLSLGCESLSHGLAVFLYAQETVSHYTCPQILTQCLCGAALMKPSNYPQHTRAHSLHLQSIQVVLALHTPPGVAMSSACVQIVCVYVYVCVHLNDCWVDTLNVQHGARNTTEPPQHF